MSTKTPTNEKRSDEPLIDIPDDKFDDGFDLKSILSARSSTDDSERKRCPDDDCHSISIYPRRPQKPDGSGWGKKYRCDECGNQFDEPKIGGVAE